MVRRFIFLTAALCVSVFQLHAQKTIWGSSSKLGEHGYGYIFKTDSVGNMVQIMHSFDSIHGTGPGLLLQASNGKLYGLTERGGSGDNVPSPVPLGGVLFEYDLVLDSLKVLHHFDDGNATFPYDRPSHDVGLIEATPGVLYGIAMGRRIIFKYTLATNTISHVATAPNFNGGAFNTTQTNSFRGPLFKASNGFIYTTLERNSACPIPQPESGGFVRINTATNALTTVYLNQCSFSDGMQYLGPKIEHNGKLYSIANGGDPIGLPAADPGKGVIYEFNPTNNAYAKKISLPGDTMGVRPTSIVKSTNGKFYGTAGGGTPYTMFSQYFPGSGIIFEYNPSNNAYSSVYEFRYNIVDSIGEHGVLSLNASNGKLYGTTFTGIFEYNPFTDVAKPRSRINSSYLSGLIEVCRKPVYQYYSVTNYTVCAGSPFTFDLDNDNATSIVWKRNNITMANQTSSELHFDNITAADAGTWTCTLTNECGTTTVPAITIVVNPSGPGTVTSVLSPSNISICEGASTVLSGNNGGTWNTGATTPTISVSEIGEYQVTNINACGNTYSNIVTVSHIPPTIPPVATIPAMVLCENALVTLSGNTGGGVWSNGATTPTTQVPIVENTSYFIVNTHTCGHDTSNIIEFYPGNVTDTSGTPHIIPLGPTTFCQTGSVTLLSNYTSNTDASWVWMYPNGNSTTAFNNPITVSQAGEYILAQNIGQCGVYRSDTVEIIIEQPLPIPVITAQGSTTFCENGSVNLQSDQYGVTWNTGDTTATKTVVQSGTYFVTEQNTCGSVISNSINITVHPLPTVNYIPPIGNFCVTESAIVLSGGSPLGGTYSGTGVSGGMFSPALAGIGTHNITYTYTDANGCSKTSVKPIIVSSAAQPVLMSNNATNSFCQGGQILLFQTQFGVVQWSNGTSGPVLFVNQSGNFYYTVTDACGTHTSNTISVIMHPIPVVNYQQTPNTICTANGNITLSAATPVGGTYSGSGVSGNVFNPISAGVGAHTITYTYTENGCTGTAQQIITVGTDTAYITPLSSTTFCQGDSVVLQGNSNNGIWSTGITAASIAVYQSGVYHVTNSSSCGTVVSQNIQVNVLQNASSNNPQTICAGESYSINGQTYTIAGNYNTIFQSNNGCDSIVTTQLTVNPVLSSNNPQSICAGESYIINGQTYTVAGNYNTIFQAMNGCDSLVTTQLTVHPVFASNNPQTICEGEEYIINGHTYTTAGNYNDAFQSVFGCDSMVVTQLSVTQVNTSVSQDGVELEAILSNADYQWINCSNNTLIIGATSQAYTAMQNGNYAVIITVNNCSDTSACYEVNNVGVQENDIQNHIVLFPNPTYEQIQLSTTEKILSISIYNTFGQQVLSVKDTTQVNISILAPGTYFITAETEKVYWRGKFVKM